MSYLLEIVGRGLLAELSAAFRDRLDDLTDVPTAGLSRLVKAHPEKASHHVRIGIRALSERKSVDARGHFEDALTREPDNVVALVGLACALDDCGQPAEAAGHLDVAHGIEPEDPAICFAIGFCREKSGDLVAAKTAYAMASELAPELRNSRERLAAIAMREQDYAVAIAQYEQLAWHEPGEIDVQLTLAGLYAHAGRHDEAIERYQYALTIDPDNWDIQDDLVEAYADAGQYEQAIEQLELLINEHPGHADHHLRLGDLRARTGDMVSARVCYEDAIELNPDYLEAHIKLGTARLRDGEYLPAADAFNNAVELNDRLLTAYVGLGVAQLAAGETAAAEESLHMAAGVEPNSTLLFSEMARLQLKASINKQVDRYVTPKPELLNEVDVVINEHAPTADLVDEQIRRHEAALARHPNYADLHYRLGVLRRHRGQLPEALQSFHKALAINPNYVKALIKAGLAHLDAGDSDAAIDAFRRALKIDPSVVELHYQLGLIFADKGQFSLAVERFEHAVCCQPNNVEFRANLALALQDMGLVDRASAAWQALSEVAPQTDRGRDLLIQINEQADE